MMSDNNDKDLRTDACPSPPRNPSDDKPFTNNHSDETTESTYHKPSKSKHSKSRSKTAKTNASNIVTMVNINNSTKVHVGDVHNYGVGNANIVQAAPDHLGTTIIRSETVNTLLTSMLPLEDEHIDFVSGHITVDGWTKIARCLQFSMGQIQQLQKRYESRGIREVVYYMLVEWKQKQPTLATLGRLGTVLWENEEEEAASRLANKLFSTIQ